MQGKVTVKTAVKPELEYAPFTPQAKPREVAPPRTVVPDVTVVKECSLPGGGCMSQAAALVAHLLAQGSRDSQAVESCPRLCRAVL